MEITTIAPTGDHWYPEVESIDTNDRTFTLIVDYDELNGIIDWAEDIAKNSTVSEGKKSGSWITEGTLGPPTDETVRTNYFGMFPINFQYFEGFGQAMKGRYRIQISYDKREEG